MNDKIRYFILETDPDYFDIKARARRKLQIVTSTTYKEIKMKTGTNICPYCDKPFPIFYKQTTNHEKKEFKNYGAATYNFNKHVLACRNKWDLKQSKYK